MNDYNIKKLYEEMELELISSMKRNLKRHLKEENDVGFEFTQWQAEKLKELKRYKRENKDIIGSYTNGLDKKVSEHLQNELKQGSIDAIKQYNKLHPDNTKKINKTLNKSFFQTNDRKVNALIKVVNNDLETANTSALRMVNDQYRQVIHKSAFFVGNGAMTEQQAIDMANKDFLSRGINSIEYKDGKRVNIASYSQMAVRTASLRAHLMGEGDFRKSIGKTLVKVTTHGGACKICTAWQGKVLVDDIYSGGKPDGKHQLLSEAMKQGFLHPNCRHGITTYYPELEDVLYETDEQGLSDEERNQLLYLERQERKTQRLNLGSIDDDNRNNYKKFNQVYKDKERQIFIDKWKINNVFINDLDIDVIKEIDKSVSYNFDKYPELKKQIKGIGSIQSRNKNKLDEIQNFYRNILELNNPNMNKEIIEKYSYIYAKKELPRAGKNIYAISQYSKTDVHKLNGIYIHNKYGGDYQKFIKCIERDVKLKWHPEGTGSIKGIIDHEIGHQLDSLLNLKNNSDIINLKKNLTRYEINNGLSRYANKNIVEFIAEAYSEYVNNENCRDIAMKVGKIIDKEYKKLF